jgi:tRNA-(ms[2]io[6]A)-hydroxylase
VVSFPATKSSIFPSLMAKKTVDLAYRTDPAWTGAILADFDAFLQDHANCERKASAFAMSLLVKYPDRIRITERLIALAREELEHFHQVYQIMEKRGLGLVDDDRDPYVNGLIARCRHGRDERFLDRLLAASIIESRGAERFRLVSEALTDPELKVFYRDLWACEAKHGNIFVELALEYFPPDQVYPRLHALADQEAAIVRDLAWRPALH